MSAPATIGPRGLALIKEAEGLRLVAYQDSVGIWTIGYGHTHGVKPGDMCTASRAEELLRVDLADAENAVRDAVRVELTQNQFDALVSFTYNLGRSSLKTSTLLMKLNAGDPDGAAREFTKWNKAGGLVLAGLVKRRAAEQALFNLADATQE